jgi:hypothetical protein
MDPFLCNQCALLVPTDESANRKMAQGNKQEGIFQAEEWCHAI